MPEIVVENLVKKYGTVTALDHVNLVIENGSFTTLLGPSGCGKTTLLRLLAGLEEANGGRILMDGRPVFSASEGINLPPKDRRLGLVFQSYALWPHMTVFQNVAYGLEERRLPKAEIKKRVDAVLERMQMSGLEGRYPNELSGGQQQRVAIARMLVMEPELLLLDEPLSNLDARLRLDMRVELQRIHREAGLTIVYVTHDQVEAMTLSTKVAVMKGGKVQQYDSPERVYRQPANLFVADFIGNPRINFLSGEVRNGLLETEGGFRFDVSGLSDSKVTVAVRPEDIEIVPPDEGTRFNVYANLMSGPDTYITLRKDDVTLLASSRRHRQLELDQEVGVHIPQDRINLFDADGRLIPYQEG